MRHLATIERTKSEASISSCRDNISKETLKAVEAPINEGTLASMERARGLIVELCTEMYRKGWASGTGGGVSIRESDSIFMAPSGVQKERLSVEDLFELSLEGEILKAPTDPSLRLSACAPLFMSAYKLRGAGAVLHSHSMNAMLATLISEREFCVTHLEMMKGISGTGYHDELVVPIIENTAHECDLADSLAEAITRYPESHAVLVRRHGVYVWGRDWAQAKVHAECYDYLFEAAVQMQRLGISARQRPITHRRSDSRRSLGDVRGSGIFERQRAFEGRTTDNAGGEQHASILARR